MDEQKSDGDDDDDKSSAENDPINSQFFLSFNLLTKNKWVYTLPNKQFLVLDDAENVTINQNMNIICVQLFKIKLLDFKMSFLAKQGKFFYEDNIENLVDQF